MRTFPRFTRPSFKPVAQRLRRLRRHLSAPRVAVIVEWLIFGAVLLFALTGGRAAFLDAWGRRADLMVLALALALQAADASLFGRDGATGDYVRRASSSQATKQFAGNGPGGADGAPGELVPV